MILPRSPHQAVDDMRVVAGLVVESRAHSRQTSLRHDFAQLLPSAGAEVSATTVDLAAPRQQSAQRFEAARQTTSRPAAFIWAFHNRRLSALDKSGWSAAVNAARPNRSGGICFGDRRQVLPWCRTATPSAIAFLFALSFPQCAAARGVASP